MAFSSGGPLTDFELELPPSGKSSASETDSDEFFDAEDSTPKSRSGIHSFLLLVVSQERLKPRTFRMSLCSFDLLIRPSCILFVWDVSEVLRSGSQNSAFSRASKIRHRTNRRQRSPSRPSPRSLRRTRGSWRKQVRCFEAWVVV